MTTATAKQEKSSPEPLPLEWTRVMRRRSQKRKDGANDNFDEVCCIDETCQRPQHLSSSKRPRSSAVEVSSDGKLLKSKVVMTNGQVIFCLHDTNPSWLQGFFFPKPSVSSSPALGMPSSSFSKPWGLLATQQELDDCLACADGGYRQIKLTLYEPGGRGRTKSGPNREGPNQIANIDWTGGDMMRLSHEEGFVTMETDRLFVGNSALPYLSKYFTRLVDQLRKNCDIEADAPILEWMPDVAVLVGEMAISSALLATTENKKSDAPKIQDVPPDEDGF